MGADSVVLCYGLRFSLGSDSQLSNEELESLEDGTEARVAAARRVGLQSQFGRVTDGGEYFLLIGMLFGPFGIQGRERGEFPDAVLAETAARTKRLLREAGLDGEPALHVQLEAQY